MRDRTLEGYWWRPEMPDEKIAGILTYDGSAPQLRLLGSFTTRVEESPGSFNVRPIKELPVVFGEAEGVAVTLVDCRQNGCNMRLGGGVRAWRQRLHVGLMLVGIWLTDPNDDQYFDQIVIGVDHLHAWAGLTGFEQGREQPSDQWTTSVTWTHKDPLKVTVGEVRIELRLGVTTSEDPRAGGSTTSFEEDAGLVVTVPALASARELIDAWPKVFQDLLTLATDTPCGLHELTLVRTDPPPEDSPYARAVTVQVYLSSTYRAKPDDKAVAPHQMLFTLADLPFDQLIKTWLEVNTKLGPVIPMLLGQRYIARSFAENRLITSVAAAEGLHRRLLPDAVYADAAAFERLKAALLDAATPEHVDWLTAKLHNEPTLRQRLRQLVEYVGADTVAPFLPKPNWWWAAAVPTRDSLVHRFEPEEGKEIDWEAVYVVSIVTSALLTLIILKELGLDQEHLASLAAHHEAFQVVRREGPKLKRP